MSYEDVTETGVGRAAPVARESRYIYGGDARTAARLAQGRTNRRATRRTVSTFNIILAIFGAGIAIVLYVGNILAVNALARDIGSLQATYDRLMSTNAALRAEVTRKAAMERIGTIAVDELKLRYPSQQPETFSVDEDLEAELKAQERAR